jgi:hypothetical protein
MATHVDLLADLTLSGGHLRLGLVEQQRSRGGVDVLIAGESVNLGQQGTEGPSNMRGRNGGKI